jgi:hypothetical protein
MVNKVLAAFVAIDILFAATGALILAFSIIVQQTCFDAPLDGNMAARDLLYQQFPFSGEPQKIHGRPDERLSWGTLLNGTKSL